MTVWDIWANVDEQQRKGMLVIPAADQYAGSSRRFDGNGHALAWAERPRLESYVTKRGKRWPRNDISPFMPGALVLNAKACEALGPFLSQFGQLLEMDVDGGIEYFFNATNLIACIDREHSAITDYGAVEKEAFLQEAIPMAPAVFKDPMTARGSLYANDAGRQVLGDIASRQHISGLWFRRAGR